MTITDLKWIGATVGIGFLVLLFGALALQEGHRSVCGCRHSQQETSR